MAIVDEIADGLARDALAIEEELGDLTIVEQVAKQIGASSPTVEEAFRTAIRMRRAEAGARRLMERLRGRGAPPVNLPARRDVPHGEA